MREGEMRQIAAWMDQVVAAPEDEALAERIRGEVRDLCASFPAPGVPVR
jgi:glycine hydroxymethyltransferase